MSDHRRESNDPPYIAEVCSACGKLTSGNDTSYLYEAWGVTDDMPSFTAHVLCVFCRDRLTDELARIRRKAAKGVRK